MATLKHNAQLDAKIDSLIERGKKIVIGDWNPQQCFELCELAGDLADEAQDAGLNDLCESLLGYTTYLSSFSDGNLAPDVHHLEQIQALTDNVDDSLQRYRGRVKVAELAPQPRAQLPGHPSIYYFGKDKQHLNLLRERFTPLGYEVHHCDSVVDVEIVLAADAALALVIDADSLGEWLSYHPTEAGGSASARVPLAVISDHDLLEVRLAAMRCAAEVVFVLPQDNYHIASRMAGLIADRSEPHRVLIVDDDHSMRMFCSSVLRHNNLQTHVAATPEEALQALQEFTPDVILADLYMPGLSGFELLALFRAHPRTAFTPVVLLSGDDDDEKRFTALHIGGDDYLTKPIRPRHLVAAITSRARRARWMRREMISMR